MKKTILFSLALVFALASVSYAMGPRPGAARGASAGSGAGKSTGSSKGTDSASNKGTGAPKGNSSTEPCEPMGPSIATIIDPCAPI